MSTPPFVILSGCSGAGKSTLLAELGRRGYLVVEEPGRRVVQKETALGGNALPWRDMDAFLRQTLALARHDYAAAPREARRWVFFDRSLIDAAAALQALGGEPALACCRQSYRYHPLVFLTPPWPEIYVQDAARRHSMEDAIAEYERLEQAYPLLGYTVMRLPKTGVGKRADYVLDALAAF